MQLQSNATASSYDKQQKNYEKITKKLRNAKKGF